MSKGACIKRMVGSHKLQYKHYYGKKKKQGEGEGLRIQNLVLIPLGHFELHFWLCLPETCKTTV